MRSIFVALLSLPLAACALVDGLKDGRFCLEAEGELLHLDGSRDEEDGCVRERVGEFKSGTLYFSLIAGETRQLVIRGIETQASESDEPLAFSIDPPSVPGLTISGVDRPDARDGTLTNLRLALAASASAAFDRADFTVRAQGVQGTSELHVTVRVVSPLEIGATRRDDVQAFEAASGPALVYSDCAVTDQAMWPRVVEIDPTSLRAKRTLWGPPVRQRAVEPCDDGSCIDSPGNDTGCFCSGLDSCDACPGGRLCPRAIGVQPGTTSALLGVGTAKLLRLDLKTGAAAAVLEEIPGPFWRIAFETAQATPPRAKVLYERMDQGMTTIRSIGRLDASTGAVEELLSNVTAGDLQLASDDEAILLGSSALSRVDLSAPKAERVPEPIAAGLASAGGDQRFILFPGERAALTVAFERVDLDSGARSQYLLDPLGSRSPSPDTESRERYAMIFDPATDRSVISQVAFKRNSGPRDRSDRSRLERIVRTATETVAVLPSTGSGDVRGSIGIRPGSPVAYVTTFGELLEVNVRLGSVRTIAQLFNPGDPGSNNVQPRRVIVDPSGGTAFVLLPGRSQPISRIDLSSGAVTTIPFNAQCAVDLALDDDGQLLIFDPSQDQLLRVDPSGQRRPALVASTLGLVDSNTDNNSDNTCSTGGPVPSGALTLTSTAGERSVWVTRPASAIVELGLGQDPSSVTRRTAYIGPGGRRLEISRSGRRAIVLDQDGLLMIDLALGTRTRLAIVGEVVDFVVEDPAGTKALLHVVENGAGAASIIRATIP